MAKFLEMPQVQGKLGASDLMNILDLYSKASKGQGLEGMKTKNPATGQVGSAGFDWSSILGGILKLFMK